MVKLLSTPFGEYGYVLTGGQTVTKPIPDPTPVGRRQDGKGATIKLPTTYDAKYLSTTSLAKGSEVIAMRDRESYAKRGLLHQGQEPVVYLEFQLPRHLRTGTVPSSLPSRAGVNDRKKSSLESLPSVKRDSRVVQKWKDTHKHHAGTSTLPKHRPGFAKKFAENRSSFGGLTGIVASGKTETESGTNTTEQTEMAENEEETTKLFLPELVKLEQQEMPFTSLGRLKSQRMHEVYSDMLKKHRENRLRLIMDKVDSAEKIRDRLHQHELEKQRRKLKTSVECQRSQLRELRSRHRKDFESRLISVYSSSENAPTILSLPRDVYGLPENEEKVEIPTPRRRIHASQSKISLQSFKKADEITSKFNNVWNLLNSPRRPQTIATADVAA
uniref:Uncharacterized protein LOC104265856 n=1 Tax=Phallusia mammillata TaxID=59560 RepID=A0A6F9DJ59_9ASCI|nr:uncharacterized protein LOC104265856 [Phallusia mammillata]